MKHCLNYCSQGYAAGGAVPSPIKNVERPFLSKYWSRWQADHTGRRYVAPSSLFGEMQFKVIRAFLFWFFELLISLDFQQHLLRSFEVLSKPFLGALVRFY